jgi:glycosyltransferase involved in cell wall biosynthesis
LNNKIKPLRVAIIGNIAGVANELLIGLRARGVDAHLFISGSDISNTFGPGREKINAKWVSFLDPFGKNNPGLPTILRVFFREITFQWLRLLRFDIIHSHTAALNFSFSSYLLYSKIHVSPYLAFATGSDYREVAQFGKGFLANITRGHFQKASKILLLNTDMVKIKPPSNFKNTSFFPFAINEEKYSPLRVEKPIELKKKLLCFMMSRLDFGINDMGDNRSSMKGNEKFFFAFRDYIEKFGNAHAIIVYRGSDRDYAKKLILDLGINDSVTFVPELNELDRIHYMRMADVVIDQFNIGSFGLGALEAMSIGKPLITFFDNESVPLCYGQPPPILNAFSSEEIFKQLVKVSKKNIQKKYSRESRKWILREHSMDVVIPRLIDLYKSSLNKR